MRYVELALLVAGVAMLVVGYRKRHRNLLLSAAIVLFLTGAIGDIAHGFVAGFADGFKAGAASAAPTR